MLCFAGVDVSLLPVIKDYWGLCAIIATAIAYPIGIFVDTIADNMLAGSNDRIKKKQGLPDDFSLLSLLHELKDNNITGYFTYNRFKTRVARSSFLNFTMIAIAVSIFIWLHGEEISIENTVTASVVIFVAFLILAATALFLWREIAKTVYERASKLWNEKGD